MSDEQNMIKLFKEGGWIVTVIGAGGMVARLIASSERGSWHYYVKRVIMAAIVSTIAFFIVEQINVSSFAKALTYGICGLISPEIIEAVIKLAKTMASNPIRFFRTKE